MNQCNICNILHFLFRKCRPIFVVLFCVSCWWYLVPYDRPDNIEHFLKKEGYTLFYPVYSPDGSKVYYLSGMGRVAGDSGSLWVIGADGLSDKKLLEGGFCGLAVSPDGSKLAVITGLAYEGGVVILSNSEGVILDTLPTTPKKVFHVEFNRDGTKLYYNGSGYFRRINTDGTNEESLSCCGTNMHFDLFQNDSIYYAAHEAEFSKYDICPINSQRVVLGVARGGSMKADLILRNLNTPKDTLLNAKAFRYSLASHPAWHPNGHKIIFAGSEPIDEYMQHWEAELWILDLEKKP